MQSSLLKSVLLLSTHAVTQPPALSEADLLARTTFGEQYDGLYDKCEWDEP